MGADDELSAPGTGIGDGEGRLDPKFITGASLALGDAFHLRSMHGIELVGVACLLCEQPGDRFGDGPKGSLEIRLTGNLAANVTVEPADKGAMRRTSRSACLWPRVWIGTIRDFVSGRAD